MTDKHPILGVSACLFRAGKVLLVERRHAPYAGLYSLPGGTLRFGERLEAAVRREVLEETGLDLPHYPFFCLHEVLEPDFHAVIAVHRGAREIPVGQDPLASDDASACRFVEISALEGLAEQQRLTPGLRALVESAHRSHLLGL
jgi:8-oxo-dGTP diphosphatase